MAFTRRAFIKLLSLALVLRFPARALAANTGRDVETILPAFLDTLMPADETPAASELLIDRALLEKAETDNRYRQLLRRGCYWLDAMARKHYQTSFADLSDDQRIHIVELMEQSRSRSLARIFFTRVRNELFEHYYSHPAGWPGLGIERPPQPHGYMDYNKPPAATS